MAQSDKLMRPGMTIGAMARNWHGYGRWEAPSWFIGPEPGQEDLGRDDLEHRRAAWERLGGALVGCRDHHLEFGFDRWHREHPAIQPTWGKLIRLLFAYGGSLRPSNDKIRFYQRDQWGALQGDTCVVDTVAHMEQIRGADSLTCLRCAN